MVREDIESVSFGAVGPRISQTEYFDTVRLISDSDGCSDDADSVHSPSPDETNPGPMALDPVAVKYQSCNQEDSRNVHRPETYFWFEGTT